MVIKVYVAMISCSQEIKKNQQRAVMILESKNIPYSIIDITDPACEDSKDYMVETATPKEGAKIPVTPQIYNEADYCGDYDGLDMANECDTLGDFLKLSDEEKAAIKIGITGIVPSSKTEETESHITNGVSASREISPEKAQTIESVAESDANPVNESQPSEAVENAEEEISPSGQEEAVSEVPAEETEVTSSQAEPATEDAAPAEEVEVEEKPEDKTEAPPEEPAGEVEPENVVNDVEEVMEPEDVVNDGGENVVESEDVNEHVTGPEEVIETNEEGETEEA